MLKRGLVVGFWVVSTLVSIGCVTTRPLPTLSSFQQQAGAVGFSQQGEGAGSAPFPWMNRTDLKVQTTRISVTDNTGFMKAVSERQLFFVTDGAGKVQAVIMSTVPQEGFVPSSSRADFEVQKTFFDLTYPEWPGALDWMAGQYLRASLPFMDALIARGKEGTPLPHREPIEVGIEKNGKVLRCLFAGQTNVVAVTPKDSSLFPPLGKQ